MCENIELIYENTEMICENFALICENAALICEDTGLIFENNKFFIRVEVSLLGFHNICFSPDNNSTIEHKMHCELWLLFWSIAHERD